MSENWFRVLSVVFLDEILASRVREEHTFHEEILVSRVRVEHTFHEEILVSRVRVELLSLKRYWYPG